MNNTENKEQYAIPSLNVFIVLGVWISALLIPFGTLLNALAAIFFGGAYGGLYPCRLKQLVFHTVCSAVVCAIVYWLILGLVCNIK